MEGDNVAVPDLVKEGVTEGVGDFEAVCDGVGLIDGVTEFEGVLDGVEVIDGVPDFEGV